MDENENSEERPRYIVRDAAFAMGPQPPLDWLIDTLISRGSVNLIYGEPGSKKTYSINQVDTSAKCL